MKALSRAILMSGASLLLILGTSACQDSSTAGQSAQSQGSEAAALDQRPTLMGVRGLMYESIERLVKDSTIVVRGTAMGNPTSDHIEKIEHTVTKVKVTESLKGSKAGATLKVRQIGGSSTRLEDQFLNLLQAGKEYIFFLTPVGLASKPDQYSVTGGAGLFRFDTADNATRLDKESNKLPKDVTIQSVRKAVGSSKQTR